LDEGLKWVKRDGLMDVLRSYRRVLVDSIPLEPIKDNRQFSAYQKHVFELLEERYLLGLRMGVENGYVLAVELARLYQEQASGGALDRLELKGNEEDEQSLHTSSNHYLQRALQYLDLAEILYTGDPNHPIWEIYEARARILMAQRRYRDALKLLSSLPQSRRNEPSNATMLNLAIRITGEKIETDESDSSSFSELLSSLFQNDGELLFRIASQNPQVARVLRNVVQRL
jgi:tetratricopeptide (TPR) repeat protein